MKSFKSIRQIVEEKKIRKGDSKIDVSGGYWVAFKRKIGSVVSSYERDQYLVIKHYRGDDIQVCVESRPLHTQTLSVGGFNLNFSHARVETQILDVDVDDIHLSVEEFLQNLIGERFLDERLAGDVRQELIAFGMFDYVGGPDDFITPPEIGPYPRSIINKIDDTSLQQWQPIHTAPRVGSVLVNDVSNGGWAIACYQAGGGWSGWIYDDMLMNDAFPIGPEPTHWYPVPPCPNEN